jgi:hypothetical protein
MSTKVPGTPGSARNSLEGSSNGGLNSNSNAATGAAAAGVSAEPPVVLTINLTLPEPPLLPEGVSAELHRQRQVRCFQGFRGLGFRV